MKMDRAEPSGSRDGSRLQGWRLLQPKAGMDPLWLLESWLPFFSTSAWMQQATERGISFLALQPQPSTIALTADHGWAWAAHPAPGERRKHRALCGQRLPGPAWGVRPSWSLTKGIQIFWASTLGKATKKNLRSYQMQESLLKIRKK